MAFVSICNAFRQRILGKAPDSFFKYTSSRWLYNERPQLEARFLKFDWQAMKRTAGKIVGARCVDMVKHAEGNDCKIFLLSFEDGSELIAKIPTALAGHPHLSTASEVATMDYARTILKQPVPKVISWCSRAEKTEVGAEYILMERAPGRELFKLWNPSPFKHEWSGILLPIARMHRNMGSCVFSQIGNIYYAEDVAPHLRERPLYAPGTAAVPGSERFKLGPLISRTSFAAGRILPEADLGPFPDSVSYFSALARIEQRWLKEHAVPRAPGDPFILNLDDNDPSIHIKLLDDFLKAIPALLPPSDLQAPVLWHTDLNVGNVFVSTDEEPSVASIIDWRGLSVLPYFIQASSPRPKFLDYDVDDRVVVGGATERARPPENMATLSKVDRKIIRDGIKFSMLHKIYDLCYQSNNTLYATLGDIPYIEDVQQAFKLCNFTWVFGLRALRRPLILLQNRWDEYAPGVPWPTTRLSEEEMDRIIEGVQKQELYDSRMSLLRQALNISADGAVPAEVYDDVKRRCDKLRAMWDDSIGPYPFQDGGRSTHFVTQRRRSP
ncbi:kinase-like domain-containing protein [Mycena polygramma]|nr:kinase-like domain-containing protein [Mycena polygramma]